MQENRNNTEEVELSEENSDNITDALEAIEVKVKSSVNKRIDFDDKTYKRLEIMLPVYGNDINKKLSNSELLSLVVGKAVDSLFEGDFKKRIEEL